MAPRVGKPPIIPTENRLVTLFIVRTPQFIEQFASHDRARLRTRSYAITKSALVA
jgi:hypothetical protein